MVALLCRPVQGCLSFTLLLLSHDSTHIIHTPLMLGRSSTAALQKRQGHTGQLRELDWPVPISRMQEHEGHAARLPVIKHLHRTDNHQHRCHHPLLPNYNYNDKDRRRYGHRHRYTPEEPTRCGQLCMRLQWPPPTCACWTVSDPVALSCPSAAAGRTCATHYTACCLETSTPYWSCQLTQS